MNDIIGAPEIFVIKGRVFRFSPLNDYECAELESWLRWRTNNFAISLYDEEALQELSTIAGAAQLLYQSIKRTEPNEVVISLAEFLDKDESACLEVFEAWMKLNIYDLKLPQLNGSNDSNSDKGSIDDVYTLLSRYYKWTVHQIMLMTKYQQAAYLKAIVGGNDGLFFDTEEEYNKHLANKNKRRKA